MLRLTSHALSFRLHILSMFGFGEAEKHHEDVYRGKHKGHLSHEMITGAAGFEAMKTWEKHQKGRGLDAKHSMAKELLAGFAAAEVEKLIETKELNHLDRMKAKREAEQQAIHLYDSMYA